jgi:zinc-ribbon domain
MAFCTACGAELENDANFCAGCGARVGATATAVAPPADVSAAGPAHAADPDYAGFFGHRRRNRDFRAHVEAALADDILSADEEASLMAWAEAQGVTDADWRKHFGDLLDRMLIASVNDGRLPDVTAQANLVLAKGERVHLLVAASLMKEVAIREFRGGSGGFSIPIAKGVRYRTSRFRGRSVVVGTELQVADQGTLSITSVRAVFAGTRRTIELPYAKLAHLNVFTDGISFNVTNRQTVPLFKVPNGHVVAAIVSAAAQRAIG